MVGIIPEYFVARFALPGALALLLTGCATRMPATIEVQVPVPVPCIQADEIPAKPGFATDPQLAGMNDYRLVISLAKDRRQRQVYEAQLEAVLAACVSVPTAPGPATPAARSP